MLNVGTEIFDVPDSDLANAWRASVRSTSPQDHDVTIYVICADPS